MLFLFFLSFFVVAVPARGVESASDHSDCTSIFNARDLTGWSGNPQVWTIKDGVLTGHVPPGLPSTQYLVWTNGPLKDFELQLSFRLTRGNAGVLYRAYRVETEMKAYEYSQLDTSFRNGRTANIHEIGPANDPGRGRLANVGDKVIIESTGPTRKLGVTTLTPDQILLKSTTNAWQRGVIKAEANHLTHYLNGDIVAEAYDMANSGPRWGRASGLLVLRVVGSMNDTEVQFKEIKLKTLSR